MSTPENQTPHLDPAPVATAQPTVPASPPPPPAPAVPFRRSPGLAVILSCFPGLGHLYLGLYQRGIAFFLAFAVAIQLADHSSLGVVVAFVWFFCLIDAYRQAQAINLAGVAPTAAATTASRSGVGALGLGVALLVIGVAALYNQFYPIDFSFLVDWWPAVLVVAGVYMIGRHLFERRKEQAAATPTDELPRY